MNDQTPLLEDEDGAPYPEHVQVVYGIAARLTSGWSTVLNRRQWKRLVPQHVPPNHVVHHDEWADMTDAEVDAIMAMAEHGRETWPNPYAPGGAG